SFDEARSTVISRTSFTPLHDAPAMSFTVSDGTATATETIAITIGNTNRAPVLAPIGNKSGSEGSLLTFTVTASDADLDPLTYSASGLPAGGSFDAATRTFSWTPSFAQAGPYPGVILMVAWKRPA